MAVEPKIVRSILPIGGKVRYDCVTSADDAHRYWLARLTADLERPPTYPGIIFIGINPSTARGIEIGDASQRKMHGFAWRLGASAYGIVNPFARSTKDIGELFNKGYEYAVGPENDHYLRSVFASAKADGWPVVAAWGPIKKFSMTWQPSVAGRLFDVICMAEDAGIELQCLGTTQEGFPRHPLMLGYEPARLTPWRQVL